MKNNISILIPAAGASSRMGAIKQLLPWGNTTLLSACVDTCLKSDASEVCVVLGAHADKIRTSEDLERVMVVQHPEWPQGLGSTIGAGARAIISSESPPEGLLIVMPDQPLVNTAYLNRLIGLFREGQHSIVATQYPEGPGVPAIFGAKHFEALAALSGEQGARKVINTVKSGILTVDPEIDLSDIDKPEDYIKLVSQLPRGNK